MAAYDGEVAHTRARRVLHSLSPFTGQEVCFDKTGYVDDVAGKAVGLLTDEAEQAVARYEKHAASARGRRYMRARTAACFPSQRSNRRQEWSI